MAESTGSLRPVPAIDKAARVLRALAEVSTKGDAIGYDDEELFPGVRAAAAPVVDARGRKIAFVMVVGFRQRIDLRTLKRIGERCASAAHALSRRMGAKSDGAHT